MKTFCPQSQASDVITEPFPHIIVKDALEEDIYLKLAAEFPSIATLNKGVDNKGTDLSIKDCTI